MRVTGRPRCSMECRSRCRKAVWSRCSERTARARPRRCAPSRVAWAGAATSGSLGLAPIVVRSIFEIVRSINLTSKVAVLLVEQNARIALDMSSTAYVLEVGRVAVQGAGSELQGNESVRRSYLGY